MIAILSMPDGMDANCKISAAKNGILLEFASGVLAVHGVVDYEGATKLRDQLTAVLAEASTVSIDRDAPGKTKARTKKGGAS